MRPSPSYRSGEHVFDDGLPGPLFRLVAHEEVAQQVFKEVQQVDFSTTRPSRAGLPVPLDVLRTFSRAVIKDWYQRDLDG